LQLAMARRLSAVPELFAVAAEQYLPVLDAVDGPAERRRIVQVLRRAADQAGLIGDQALVNTLLAAALRLSDPHDTDTLVDLHISRHAALFGLGRLDEADEEHRTIEVLCPAPTGRAPATVVQVKSLTIRNRFSEAMELGLGSLRDLGVTVPPADRVAADIDAQFGHLYRWLDHTDHEDDAARPEITDGTLLAAARVLNATLPAAYNIDPSLQAWLSLEALRMWVEHGPSSSLLGPASVAAYGVVALRGDGPAGYRAMRRILALGEARAYEPDTSQVRWVFALHGCWFEPIEDTARTARRALEGLTAGGDLTNAGYTYHPVVFYLLDCGSRLGDVLAEVEAGLAFARRTGSEQTGLLLAPYRWLIGTLLGESSSPSGEAVPDQRYVDNPMAQFYDHLNRALAAAVLGDPRGTARHTAAAVPLLAAVVGHYPSALARLLHGLALAEQARAADGAGRRRLLSELDEVIRWLAARAADAPDNFLHLVRWLEAERAWASEDFRAAAVAFDAALREPAGRRRSWHRALAGERAARFCLAHGLDNLGHDLLAQARDRYHAWGAIAKVAQMDWAHPDLRRGAETPAGPGGDQPATLLRRSAVTTGTLDLLGILSASQALSSETSLDRLHARVVEVLGALTGAGAVHLLLRRPDSEDWLLPTPSGTVAVAGHETATPLSVLRYVERTAEPLVVADATDDDRFARDPHFADADCCSLLAVPILSRGTLRAVLVLENRLLRSAFTTDRLDAVTLVAGQLAVSLDNAQLYAELTNSRARIVTAADQARRRIERDLHDGAQQRLVSLALRLRRSARAATQSGGGGPTVPLDEVAGELDSVLDDLRELARGIHPAVLAAGGLVPALKTLARRSAVPVHLDVHVDRRLPEPIELAAYYAVAEALTNAAKHARATVVDVRVEAGDGDLRIEVRDDGRGGADRAGGSGLVGLTDRIEALGGRVTLRSPWGAGTTLTMALPLDDSGLPG
jgi:signal transduction histidine kinase